MLEGFFSRKFSRRGAPWGRSPALFTQIHRRTQKGSIGFAGKALEEEEPPAPGRPGEHDGRRIHDGDVQENLSLAGAVYHALVRALETEDPICQARLYELVEEDRAIEYVDQVLDRILEEREPAPQALHDLALWWAVKAPHRGAVKFAVALLGLFDAEQDLPVLLTLGRHEEFTLFAAIALSNREGEPGKLTMELARDLKGWGRVHAVELLCESPGREVRRWLLTEGFRGEVGRRHMASLCARAGGLSRTLARMRKDSARHAREGRRPPGLDRPIIDGACRLLLTLLTDPDEREKRNTVSPLDGVEYRSLGEALDHLTALLGRGCRLNNLPFVHRVADLLGDSGRASATAISGLDQAATEQILHRAQAILKHTSWQELIANELKSPVERRRRRAHKAAQLLSLEPPPQSTSE